jgi:hypothetical protein
MHCKKIAAVTLVMFLCTGNIHAMAQEERDDARFAAHKKSAIKSLLKGALSGAISGASYALYSCADQCTEQNSGSVQCNWTVENSYQYLLPNPDPAWIPPRYSYHHEIIHHSATHSDWLEAGQAYLVDLVTLGLMLGAEVGYLAHIFTHQN